jgi:hypothetical protein
VLIEGCGSAIGLFDEGNAFPPLSASIRPAIVGEMIDNRHAHEMIVFRESNKVTVGTQSSVITLDTN